MRVSKKLLAIIAPILAATALAMPAVAQAASPHYYLNGTQVPEGEQVPVLEWGKLTLWVEDADVEVTCEVVAGGFAENPAGSLTPGSEKPGIGQTTRFSTWNCSNRECPAGAVEIGGHKYEKEFEVVWPPQDLPWPNELIGLAGKTKLNSTGVVMTLGCYAHGLTKAEKETGKATGPGENEQFPLAAPFRCETVGTTHLWDPENVRGSNLGNLQSTLVFNQPVATGPSCIGGAFPSDITGSLKVIGYDASGLITVKTP
jgi:hypothetical protein